MEKHKQKILVKIIILLALVCGAWFLGFVSGLKQGQKQALEKTPLSNEFKAQNQAPNLPKPPPEVQQNQGKKQIQALPQIPATLK